MLARLSFPIHDVSGDDTSSMVWALYGQVAVPMRVPDAGRVPRNIFHPVQIGCELACLRQLLLRQFGVFQSLFRV
jgi:hypothetical protein